jgi:hypothetical protein
MIVANIEHQSTCLLNQFVLLLLIRAYSSANTSQLDIDGQQSILWLALNQFQLFSCEGECSEYLPAGGTLCFLARASRRAYYDDSVLRQGGSIGEVRYDNSESSPRNHSFLISNSHNSEGYFIPDDILCNLDHIC